ncbi:MAG: carboxynorspermidine decarboxylase [Methylococcaceae bacterium]|nr:carboxynorspermidine decarboxylase [Methylococcaceae bacterium]
MDLTIEKANLDSTPAFVIDENRLIKNLSDLVELKRQSGCQVLYSMKALPFGMVLKLAKKYLDGLSVSSLFEARLAKEILGDTGHIHISTPGLRDDEFNQVIELCSHISFNSICQYQRLAGFATNRCAVGLRLNPKLSFTNDSRFDPCRLYSKLGIDIDSLGSIMDKIEGLHFHTVFSTTDYIPLVETVALLKHKLGDKLSQLKWLNLGGGYLYSQIQNHQPFIDLVKQLKVAYDLEVYIEPGKAIVGDAGYLVTSVIDCFTSDGKTIVVLDTSVNHNPEIFEYQRKPELLEANGEGKYSCLLVGSSCLAGDLFGEYQFESMPKLGDRLVFPNVGAYSLIKANRFNGYNLPDIYKIDTENNLKLIKQNNYLNYREQWT